MEKVSIQGATRTLNRPKNWDEAKFGPCGDLAIREDTIQGGIPLMVSAWKPNEEEIKMLQEGGVICLGIAGLNHPPVSIHIEKA